MEIVTSQFRSFPKTNWFGYINKIIEVRFIFNQVFGFFLVYSLFWLPLELSYFAKFWYKNETINIYSENVNATQHPSCRWKYDKMAKMCLHLPECCCHQHFNRCLCIECSIFLGILLNPVGGSDSCAFLIFCSVWSILHIFGFISSKNENEKYFWSVDRHIQRK